MSFKIAVDGPAGAGKSTISKAIAKILNIEYLDTGAMYRAVALKAINLGIDLKDESKFDFVNDTVIDFVNGRLILDGNDVNDLIRTKEIGDGASLVSTYRIVREKLVFEQRRMSEAKSVILDGRDIGTVVFPNAELKIFLVASVEVRAERRYKERLEKGDNSISLEETIKEIEARDLQDSTRAISPLKKAEDAVEVDTSNLSIDAVIKEIVRLVTERGLKMEDVKIDVKNEEEVLEQEENVEAEEKVEENAPAEELAPEASEEKVEAAEPEKKELPKLKELQLVEGTVIEIIAAESEKKDAEGKVVRKAKEARVLVQLDDGNEGYLFKKDIPGIESDEDLFDEFIEGDKLRLIVKKVYPDGGRVVLSASLLEKRDNLKKFEEVIENHGTFKAKVVKAIQVGLVLEHDGYSCLLPTSQVAVPEEEMATLVGTEIDVAPIRVDYNRIRLIVSQKVANAIESRQAKDEFLKNIKVGDEFEGKVKNIESYGAFIDLGNGVEGLLHISEVEHNRIVKIEKVLKAGDTVKVKVIKLDEAGHIGLSRKALLPNYWKDFIDASEVGQVVKGTVSEINNAGVVVALTEQIQGFLPKSEISWNKDQAIEDTIQLNDEVEAKIIELDLNKKRVILSSKQLVENPWETLALKAGDVVDCKVLKVTEDGVKFLSNGVTGFLPKVNYGEKTEFAVGEEFQAKVRIFDAEKNKLSVSMREPRPKVERENKKPNNEVNKMLKNQDKIGSTFGDFINLDDYK
ncbi:MAG: (d)CMP kinase [Bacilli bacterium]|nr:(d)CMP kinase [Bacilli bacterium]